MWELIAVLAGVTVVVMFVALVVLGFVLNAALTRYDALHESFRAFSRARGQVTP